ncbi:MAG: hypothetical protein J5725_00465 [Bacteroidales bacterium]|nr:hypothetical protein [Bacteroidales bacterium]
MVTQAYYEEYMRTNKENNDKKNAIKDTITILKQDGYDAGADILAEMFLGEKDNEKG